MTPDPSWNSEAPPPRKPGLSVFGKVLIGCGAAMLCFILAVGALSWVVFSKATKAMDRAWADVHRDLQDLRTEPGARRLYREQPGLAQTYATEDEFVKASAAWRDKLGDIPAKRPDLAQIVAGKGPGSLSIRTRDVDGRKVTAIRMRTSTGAMLVVELENDKLTDLHVE
jgi:hypothetical protein